MRLVQNWNGEVSEVKHPEIIQKPEFKNARHLGFCAGWHLRCSHSRSNTSGLEKNRADPEVQAGFSADSAVGSEPGSANGTGFGTTPARVFRDFSRICSSHERPPNSDPTPATTSVSGVRIRGPGRRRGD
jgi:hypothetical protein